MRTAIVIPARYAATRLPGKPLLEVGGEPMIVRVWKRCRLVREAETVMVATDDERIRKAVAEAGGDAVMTATTHRSGTDRVAEVAAGLDCDIIVNVQGDEPFIDPASLESLIASFESERGSGVGAATLATPIRMRDELFDPSVVKVVINRRGEAIYFSRYPVPYSGELWRAEGESWTAVPGDGLVETGQPYLRHVGTYAYRTGFLERFARWERGFAEKRESLEQLRILEEGEKIRVVVVPAAAAGIDTAEDLARARKTAGAGYEV